MTVNAEWIGVDLDGTLAKWYWGKDGKEYDPLKIGKPVKVMQFRVQDWLGKGVRVKIFTARIAPPIGHTEEINIIRAIQDWTHGHVGKPLEVTCVKDRDMVELWDDRAMQVRFNEGVTLLEELEDVTLENEYLEYVAAYGPGIEGRQM